MAVDLLPDEVIVEILSMLPAKSLLRLQLVCKYWLNLISSTRFKLMHLHNFNQLNPRYFVRRRHKADDEWYDVHLDDEAFTLDDSTQIEFPFVRIRESYCFRIVGCCHGVVCLFDELSVERIILWNPSIRRKLIVPVFYTNYSFNVLGFGYDKLSDDYKLVRLVYINFNRPHVQVYTLKTGIWRREVMFPDNLVSYFTHPNRLQVFFNGSVHWTSCQPNPRVPHTSIMTFDISTELFGDILLPDDLGKVEPSTVMISVVGESLAVTHYNRLINEGSTYKTWVMKEYNNPTSWTLMYNMHYPDVEMGIPLQMQNMGDAIIKLRNENIIFYNYSGCASSFYPRYEPERCTIYVDKYQESLALLDVGSSAIPNEETDEGFDDD